MPRERLNRACPGSPHLFDESEKFDTVFEREVKRCRPLLERLEGAEQTGHVRGMRRLAHRNQRIAGDGWIMIGDAAAFLDPIYSSGLFLALTSAELAACCLRFYGTTGVVTVLLRFPSIVSTTGMSVGIRAPSGIRMLIWYRPT